MSKYDIGSQFECQNRILNVIMRYSAKIRMSKKDFECQNTIFRHSTNVKMGFGTSKDDIRPQFESNVKIGF